MSSAAVSLGGASARGQASDSPASAPEVDEARFRERLARSDFPAELFLPVSNARWRGDRFVLERAEVAAVRTRISGVRLQPASRRSERGPRAAARPARGPHVEPSGIEEDRSGDRTAERETQEDVVDLLRSWIRLRELGGLAGAVLSTDFLLTRPPRPAEGARVKFGLRRAADGRFEDEVAAARESHRAILAAVRASGLVVGEPRVFDPSTGLQGLVDWGARLRLRRKRRIRPWLLLPLALLLLLLPLRGCDPSGSFFGVPLATRSLIVVVDKSSSMEPYFPVVRAEAKNVLAGMLGSSTKHYANVVAYDSDARSALGGLTEVTPESSARLQQFLDGLGPGGGTNLRAGLELAAKEVAAHEQPTTLVILTDGRDASIATMLADMQPILSAFQGVEVIGNTLTPRLFGGGDPAPLDEVERSLKDLAERMRGRFGPADAEGTAGGEGGGQ